MPPRMLNIKAVKNLNNLQQRLTDRTKRGSWHKLLLKKITELSVSYEVLVTKNVRIELSQMLFDTYKLEKTEHQIKSAIEDFRNYARDGRIPPSFTTDKEIANFKKIKDKLDVREARRNVREARRKSDWLHFLAKELSRNTDFIVRSDSAERAELARLLLENFGIEKSLHQISNGISYLRELAKEGRNPFFAPSELKDFENIKEKLLSTQRKKKKKGAKTTPSASKKKPKGKFEKVPEGRVQKKKTARQNVKNKRGTVATSPTRKIGNTKELLEAQKEFSNLRREVGNLEKEPNVKKEKFDFGVTKFDDGDLSEFLNEDMSRLLELPGQEIGGGHHKYTINDLIGHGTFGVVFRALHRNTGKMCALKCVTDEEMIELEVNAINSINKHRPLSRFLCVPTHAFKASYDGLRFHCFPMDLLRTDLHNLFFSREHATKVFPPPTVLSIIGQVSSAVAFLNGVGFIYGDIKVDNVMLEKFDLEKVGEKDLVVNAAVRLIDVNTVLPIGLAPCNCQSAPYRAPETIFRTSLDPRIDSWSMGILGVELLMKDNLIDVEYNPEEDNEKVMEHIARIEYALGEEIPMDMWMSSTLNKDDLPDVSTDQKTLNDVWNTMEPSICSGAIQAFIPRLLKINAGERLTPAAAENFLRELIPRP